MRFCPTCGSTFRGTFAYCSIDGSALEQPQHDPNLGRRVGGYRLEALLGEGGTGKVYRATGAKDGSVAIKLLWGDLASDQRVWRRLERAHAATTAIRHSAVVSVLELASTPEGLGYLLMPYIEGPSLRRQLDEAGPMSPKQAAQVGIDIADGLEAAHQAGYVHRDIKPANVVLDQGSARILDFGLAGALEGGEDVRITASGTFVGTPLYMAPEQARSASEISASADVYALGVVLFELISGLAPFRGKTPLEVMFAHASQTAPRLQVGGAMADVVAACMSKAPIDRPRSAGALRDALARALPSLSDESLKASCQSPPAPAETLELKA